MVNESIASLRRCEKFKKKNPRSSYSITIEMEIK